MDKLNLIMPQTFLPSLFSKNALAFATIAIAFTGGCTTETTDSTNIATRGIWAGVDLDSDRPGETRVNVELNVGGSTGTNIELSGNERLEASIGSVAQTLTKDANLFDVDYRSYFSTSSSAQPFRITFYRDNGSVNSGTTVTLPDEYSITSPSSGQSFDSDSTIPVMWTPARANQSISLTLITTCTTLVNQFFTNSNTVTVTDDGVENYNISQLPGLTDPNIDRSKNCELNIRLSRRSFGTLDPAFEEGGHVNATQSRNIDNIIITLNP